MGFPSSKQSAQEPIGTVAAEWLALRYSSGRQDIVEIGGHIAGGGTWLLQKSAPGIATAES